MFRSSAVTRRTTNPNDFARRGCRPAFLPTLIADNQAS
jgi:hypothetical protein